MPYIIKEKRLEGLNIITKVLFTFTNGMQKEIDVIHFLPSSKNDILNGIENREISEQREIEAPAKLRQIMEEIDITT